jgi:uncharacterized membrane protein
VSLAIAAAWIGAGLLALIRAFVVLADSAPAAALLAFVAVALIVLGYRLLVAPTKRALAVSACLGATAFLVTLPAMAGAGAGPWGAAGIALLLIFGGAAVLSLAARRSLTA